MGKKRGRSEPSGARKSASSGPRGVDRADGRIRPISTWGDALAGDDANGEDLFDANADKVALEVDDGSVPVLGRRAGRAAARELDDAALGLGDEVLSLDLPAPASDDEEDEEGEEIAAAPRKRKRLDRSGDDVPSAPTLPLSRFARPDPTAQDRLASDDEDADGTEEDEDSEDEPDKWNKRAYHVNAGEDPEPESDDEEGVELQLNEVKRLQRERRAKLTEADFAPFPQKDGLGLPAVGSGKTVRIDAKRLFAADTTATNKPTFVSRAHAIAHLLRHEPEVLALVDDFVQMAEEHAHSAARLDPVDPSEIDADQSERAGQALEYLYHDTLTTYLTTLAFYFSLRLSPQPTHALQQTVLGRVLQLRTGLSALDEEGFGTGGDEDEETVPSRRAPNGRSAPSLELGALGDAELESIVAELRAVRAEGGDETAVMARLHAALEGPNAEGGSDDDDESESGVESDEMDVVEATPARAPTPVLKVVKSAAPSLPALPPRRARARRDETADDDLLDPTVLSTADASDKAAAKHSLRFHTAQIDAKAARRAAAGSSRSRATGGDDDVPYRSKERSRAAVVKERQSVANRARNALTAEDGADWGMDDAEGTADAGLGSEAQVRPSLVRSRADSALAYFDLVKRSKADAKKAKRDAHEAERAADRDALAVEHGSAEDGPRAANRTILNNRGLTPKRQKLNRNPRVKKRVRYETAKSKVASQRPVFNAAKAHAGRSGGYEGESTGINRRTVKSRKLG